MKYLTIKVIGISIQTVSDTEKPDSFPKQRVIGKSISLNSLPNFDSKTEFNLIIKTFELQII